MTQSRHGFLGFIWTQFQQEDNDHLNRYYTFQNYRQIWGIAIFILMTAALLPLIFMTFTYYRLMETSIDTESLLRTERLASNTRRAVTFFLEERLDALRFTGREMGYDQLTDPERLSEALRNLKLGFGGVTDLGVIAENGAQVAYAGPFNLEGKDYSGQPWFIKCQQHSACVSETFLGYRDVPHIVVAVKSARSDGQFFILRATIETERLIQTMKSYKVGQHTDIFLINREGLFQTPSQFYAGESKHLDIPVPGYSDRTKALMSEDREGRPIVVSYAFINTNIVPTPFILMVVKQKVGMMKVWLDLRTHINWFFGVSAVVLAIVITLTSTFMVNKIFQADRQKAHSMAMMEQNAQLASIGQLAAGVAHEINNPLALINETAGYVKDLFLIKKQYQKDQELVEHFDSIIEAVERCGTITGQLLGFARRFDFHTQPINLKDLITDVLNFHNKEAEYRDIAIHLDIPENLPLIETDRGKLQQIILNLVNNAFQAIDDGCFLDIQAEMEGADKVRLAIGDNGCGIAEDHLKKVFEPFFTTKKEGKGTGLGLSITYGLVKNLQGNITVQSKPGEGTTFVITLPIQLQKEVS
jgi:two-component system NtrC family sensor kinase